jgi:hypothetical protein
VHFYLFSHVAEHGNPTLKAYPEEMREEKGNRVGRAFFNSLPTKRFHASELPFVFQKPAPKFYGGVIKVFPTEFSAAEISLISDIIDTWTTFGKQEVSKFHKF